MAYRVLVIDQTIVVPDDSPRELTTEPFCFATVVRVDDPDRTLLRFGASSAQGIPVSRPITWEIVERDDSRGLWYTNPVVGVGQIYIVLSGTFRAE